MIRINVGELFVQIKADSSQLVTGLTDAQGKVSKSADAIAKKLGSIGKGMTIAGGAITAAFGLAVKTAKDFEQSMANTASVAGATGEELEKLSNYAREMGEQSVFSASEAADAMYYLASAGMNTEEIMGALEGTLALAAATASDLSYTSASVAASLSQFGLEADEAGRVANVFAAAISGSQATMEKLTTSMSYVGPMANSMGMSIEDTTGILMNLYNAGLDGSKAGTALRMAFVQLIDPTEDGAAALDKLGVAIKDSEGNMRPFKDIIDELGIAGMSTADAMDIFGVRAGPAMMALVSQGTGAIQEMTDAVTDTEKATEMAAMQIDTFEGFIKLLKSAFEELQITLVSDLMPTLKDLIGKFTEGVKGVTAWMKANPELTATIVKITASVGALMLVLGPLLMMLPGLVTAFSALAPVIAALTSPIGLVVIAAGALYLAFTNWDKLVEIVGNIKDKVVAKIKEWAGAIDKWWQNIVDTTDNKWILVADKIIKAVGDVIKWFATTIGGWISDIAGWWSNIETDTDSIWSNIANVIMDSVKAWIDFFANTLPGWILDITNWWEDIKSNTENIWGAIKTAIVDIVKNIWDSITSILEPIVGFISGLWDSIGGNTSSAWGNISSIISTAVGGIVSVINGMISAINTAWATAKSIYNSIKDIVDAAQSLVNEGITIGPETAPGWEPGGASAPEPEPVTPAPVYGYHALGTPYIPKTGLYGLHKGEAVIPANENPFTGGNKDNTNNATVNINSGAIVINTPKFGESDAQEIFRLIERQARNRGLKFATS